MTGAGGVAPAAPSRFPLLLACVALLAFAVRELFVLTAVVEAPIVGDIVEYVSYAWNLVHHGVYSHAMPDPRVVPSPDSYRMPGYPGLIALGMTWFPTRWIAFVLQVQVVLGTATVLLVGLLARRWLSTAWAIAAAALLALWPHHIAATGAMLSEVAFGFLLVLAAYCFARAWSSDRLSAFCATGVAFAAAWLVNPIVMLFPPLLAALAWRHGRGRAAAVLLGVFVLPIAAMSLREADLPGESGSSQRARINFVQGSWPEYHEAANRFRTGDKIAIAIMREIDDETNALRASTPNGLARISERMASYPTFYVKWYLAKPWHAWGWRIGLGASDVGFLRTQHSPLERNLVLRGVVQAYKFVNPVLTTILLMCAAVLVVAGLRRSRWVPAAAVGALAVYLTLMHVILQADPRHATAYRGLEAILVATALAWCVGKVRGRGGVRHFRRVHTI